MAIWQHVVGADHIKQLSQFLAATQYAVGFHAVVEVVWIDVGEADTLHDAAQVILTIFRRTFKPCHAHFKQSFLIRDANLQTFSRLTD